MDIGWKGICLETSIFFCVTTTFSRQNFANLILEKDENY